MNGEKNGWVKFDRNEWRLWRDGRMVAECGRERPQKFSLVHGYVQDHDRPWLWSAFVYTGETTRELDIPNGAEVRQVKTLIKQTLDAGA